MSYETRKTSIFTSTMACQRKHQNPSDQSESDAQHSACGKTQSGDS